MEKQLSPLVDLLDLKPHIEGGWYREVWRTSIEIPQPVLGSKYSGPRAAATSVYFLLHPGEVSKWHAVLSDELWLWHSGSPLLLTLGGKGAEPKQSEEIVLGMDLSKGQRPQALVPASIWQMASPMGDEPVLVSCIVAPGFHFDDFTMIRE
ncbi:cupin domain-containing protein [Paenibacillus alkalitolerans]|uniref:cupin domain-containing protein n=1 Tax=Paenibacillus alkalitolerans TaxID=2799335 RepID=UPI0018F33308|nr:cupin domain-containing protein [Paenibacillus alkalitolerans]